jgi:hypothetical protein
VKWVAVSLAVGLLLCAGALVWQQREISEMRRDDRSAASAAAEARANALIATPLSRWGYSVPVPDAARLVATLCSLPASQARALEDLEEERYGMLTYLVGEFAHTCEPRRHR